MAKENFTRFLEAASTDKTLAKKLSALAAEHGYVFTAEEFLEFTSIQPLTDEDVESIAGGPMPCTPQSCGRGAV